MVSVEYSKAISEVLDILKHTKKEDLNKISPEFMNFLKENASKDYIPEFDHSNGIASLKLNEKTIGILSVINSEFWCTPEQKEVFENKLKENEKKHQEELRTKYNPDNIFKNKNNNIKNAENVSVVEYRETLLTKFINIIKKLFKR